VRQDEVQAAAGALLAAERSGVQTGLLSAAYPGAGMDEAYRIQAAVIAAKIAGGRRVIGWKIGLTSRAMQQSLGIDIPDSGVLLDDMDFPPGAVIPKGRFIAPRIEAEIAFLTRAPLAGRVTRDEVLEATEAVAPALEILDTRILRRQGGQSRTIVDTIADNAANGGVIVGEMRHDPRALDLRRVGVILFRDGVVEETGLGAGVLNDPVAGIVWLAERLGRYGQSIGAGQVILSGSFVRAVECPPGTRIEADFGDFGSIACRFGGA